MQPVSINKPGVTQNVSEWAELTKARRAHFSEDPHYPRYHFVAPSGWLNDPNGLIQWNGHYHLFYQHNPHEAAWGPPHWGHAVSDDLIHWQDLPIALTPEMTPADDGGCWSGCAVDDQGTPTLIYTGVKSGETTTCLALGDDTLINWKKYEKNPVARAPRHPEHTHQAYRDPFVWREGENWYQVIGTSLQGRGQVFLHRSDDLKNWQYLHPLVPEGVRATLSDSGEIWECPNFFRLGDKHVLIVSLWQGGVLTYPVAFIGHRQGQHFYPEHMQRLDWGEQCFYAPLTLRNDQGRLLMWGWLQEQRSKEAQLKAGWSGVISLPRVLSLDSNGHLQMEFASEIQALRRERVQLKHPEAGAVVNTGPTLELQLTLERGRARRSGLKLGGLAKDGEEVRIYVDWEARQLVIDRGRSILNQKLQVQRGVFETFNDTVKLHAYLDHSVLEIIANKQLALSARLYSAWDNDLSLQLFSEGGNSKGAHFEAWRLAGIW